MSYRIRLHAPGRNFRSTFRYYPARFVVHPRVDIENYRRRTADFERMFDRLGLNLDAFARYPDEEEYLPNADALKIVDIDLNISENTKEHHSENYEITMSTDDYGRPQTPRLVVRRGQPFNVTLRFNRPYNKDTDKVTIQFSLGERPKIPKNTLVRLPIPSSDTDSGWTATIKETAGSDMTLTVTPPSNCYVGKWRMMGCIVDSDNQTRLSKQKDVCILFNPFNKDDDVYMHDSQEREEYVMNEFGLIFVGTSERIRKRTWNFAQFQGNILDCILYLLDKSEMPYTDRGKPVLVSRRLSAMVNESDDGGVLRGNWSGDYEGGTSPLEWQGSERILEQYWQTKKRVKFGQCWVFSGVLTTACRALGIPCRSVTNFDSAHDTDSSVTIDKFYNENYEYEDMMNEDSVWNFHVWNEAYMTRPDLRDKHYGGWQAIDATPQETSNGIYCCGPCPVRALKNGDIGVNYDASFIMAEVNADSFAWVRQNDGNFIKIQLSSDEIGRYISTKSILKPERNDITHEYKFAEGSAAERVAVLRAVRAGTRADDFHTGIEDVKMEVTLDPTILIGSDFHAKIKIENVSSEVRVVKGNFSVMSVFYTGVLAHSILKHPVKVEIQPGSNELIEIIVKYEEYASKLMDHCGINLTGMLLVDTTNQPLYYNKSYGLEKPDLQIKAPNKGKTGESFDVEVSFKNPLKISLTSCVLRVEGPGLSKGQDLRQKNIGPGETFLTLIQLTPRLPGSRTIHLNFTCDQIAGIDGSHFITIEQS